MEKRRIGEDFKYVWSINWNGVPEDFSDTLEMVLTASVYGKRKKLERDVDYVVDGNLLKIDFTPKICTSSGIYNLELNYVKPSDGFIDGERRSAVDIDAFQIVLKSAQITATGGITGTSDAIIGFYGLSAYEVWLKDNPESTKEDYYNWLRQPATDAAESIAELEQTVSGNEALRVTAEQGRSDAEFIREGAESARSDAEGDREDAEVLRNEAEGLRELAELARANAESDRVDAEDLRDQAEVAREEAEEARANAEGDETKGRVKAESDRVDAEDLRDQAEVAREEAEEARVNAEGDETKGRVKAENDRVAAEILRNETFDQKMNDADDKIEEMDGTLSAYDGRVTQVESDIDQLAGEVNHNPALETVSKSVVGAINEVNRIVSIHHADNKAVRRWNNTLSTPIGEAVGDLDFLRELPRILGLGCYLVADDLTKKKLHRDNHNFYEDGSPALLDGSEGQYMFCWGAFYFTTWEEGDYTYEAISLQPIIGKKSYYIPAGGYSAIGHGVIDRTDLTLCSVVNSDPRYRGGGNAVLTGTLAGENDPQTTMLGMPATVYGIHTAQTYARKRGENWNACWFVSRAAIEILIRIVYGNRHTQSAVLPKDVNGLYQGGFGSGLAGMPDWTAYNGTYPLVPTSAGVEYGDLCGSFDYTIPKADGTAYHTTGIPSFFGLKNFFGHLWFGVAGLTINATETVTEAYVMPSMFGGWNHNSLEGMLKAAELPRVNGYIGKLSMNLLCALPIELGASASTKYADYFYENTAGGSYGLRARWGGGLASTGALAGAFCTYSNTAATTAHANRSVPLCFFEEDPIVEI